VVVGAGSSTGTGVEHARSLADDAPCQVLATFLVPTSVMERRRRSSRRLPDDIRGLIPQPNVRRQPASSQLDPSESDGQWLRILPRLDASSVRPITRGLCLCPLLGRFTIIAQMNAGSRLTAVTAGISPRSNRCRYLRVSLLPALIDVTMMPDPLGASPPRRDWKDDSFCN
jgi:hypothetical protein